MTRPLVAIERFFERLFERPATRLFHPRLQPIQLERRLERAMESERWVNDRRTYVHDRYRVLLNPADYADFEGFRGTLESDLAEALLVRARQRGYTLLARPRVRLQASAGVGSGEISVVTETHDAGATPSDQVPPSRPNGGGPRAAQNVGADHPSAAAVIHDAQAPASPRRPAESDPAAPAAAAALARRDAATAQFPAPVVLAPSAIIEVAGPTMPPKRVAFRGGTLVVGRAPDCDIVLADERVSRRHGSVTSRKGALIFTDLTSTNGSFVNGTRVTEIVLGTGDVVRLGNTTLTIRPQL
ncbi:MAG: DUF3662 and FHA domain-containing protein [Candidatus Limnocylindrales bacterium]